MDALVADAEALGFALKRKLLLFLQYSENEERDKSWKCERKKEIWMTNGLVNIAEYQVRRLAVFPPYLSAVLKLCSYRVVRLCEKFPWLLASDRGADLAFEIK
jgi:hypothetical protein